MVPLLILSLNLSLSLTPTLTLTLTPTPTLTLTPTLTPSLTLILPPPLTPHPYPLHQVFLFIFSVLSMQVLTGMYDTIHGGVCDDAKPWRSNAPSSDAWQKGEAYDVWWKDYDAHCNTKPRWHFDEFQHAFLTIFQVVGSR